MRSLEDARLGWQELEQYNSLLGLKNAIRLEKGSSVATRGLRSFCWKAFLLFDTLDLPTCQQTLTSSRLAYNTLRAHLLRLIDNPDDVGSGFDPLSQDDKSSQWAELSKDEELRAEILQDVERCMPDNDFFRKTEVKSMLLDILFVFCKLNPDVGYRQGMHELLAPILWVVHEDAVDIGKGSKVLGDSATIANMFDADHVEHDAFALFGQVMQSSKNFYVSEGPDSIASRSRHIFDELLPKVDPDLKKHLAYLDVVPQVYLIRWIRLLFGREFDFQSVLTLWDAIFAEDTSLEIVNFICLAMLLRIRWDLMDSDYNGVLSLLLRYPEPDREFPAQNLAFDAIALRENLTLEKSSLIVRKYTGRPLSRANRPATPPALQRNITAFSGFTSRRGSDRKNALSPSRAPLQARNLEALLRNTAKSIHASGERLGIGKAVRNAVEEVHRKAQEIRETQTPSPSANWRRNGGQPDSAQLLAKITSMEDRNKRLSELLAGAVGELWNYQKVITGGKSESSDTEDHVENLSAAIAKVQFVQVYLDEPSLVLGESTDGETEDLKVMAGERTEGTETRDFEEATVVPSTEAPRIVLTSGEHKTQSPQVQGLADPSSFEDISESHTSSVEHNTSLLPVRSNVTRSEDGPTQNGKPMTSTRPPRPPLAQSEFSFMLGQDGDTQRDGLRRSFNNVTPPARRQEAGGSSLFGYGEDDTTVSKASPDRQGAARWDNSDSFDIGSLRRAPRAPKPGDSKG